MIENIRLSFQGIWAHKMRSFLTMLGIIIGIAALISIVSTIEGTNEQIKKNLIGGGDNVIEIILRQIIKPQKSWCFLTKQRQLISFQKARKWGRLLR